MKVVFKITRTQDANIIEFEPLDFHLTRLTITDGVTEMSSDIRNEDLYEALDGCKEYVAQKAEQTEERMEKLKLKREERSKKNDMG